MDTHLKKSKNKKKFKNRYIPNNEPPKRHEAKLKGTEEMTNSKIITRDFNIPLSVTDRIRNSASIQNNMNNTINQLKTLLTIYFKTAEYTCFPKEHRTFSRTDLALEQ